MRIFDELIYIMPNKYDICAARILSCIRLMGYLEAHRNRLRQAIKSNQHLVMLMGCAVAGAFFLFAVNNLQYFLTLEGCEVG